MPKRKTNSAVQLGHKASFHLVRLVVHSNIYAVPTLASQQSRTGCRPAIWPGCRWLYAVANTLSMQASPFLCRVPARCARIPLSTWLGAFVPRRGASSRRRHRLTTAATVSLDVYAHRSTNTSYHRRRSRLSCRRRSCLEWTVT